MRALLVAALAACGALYSVPASAQLSVDHLWVDFEPGAPNRADITIRNDSTDKYYITVTPAEITAPGTDAEARVEVSDPEALGILVTPNRLVIEPGGMRSIRIVTLNNDIPADRIYRVKITPQVGAVQTNVAAGQTGIAIKILAAYDILVTARPKKARPDVVATRQPGELVIRNAGNTNALLYEGQACVPRTDSTPVAPDPKSDAKAAPSNEICTPLGARRIYAGNEWKIPLPDNAAKIRFKQRSFESSDPKAIGF